MCQIARRSLIMASGTVMMLVALPAPGNAGRASPGGPILFAGRLTGHGLVQLYQGHDLVSSVFTRGDGGFRLRVPFAGRLVRESRANDGYVNLMMVATDGTFVRPIYFSRTFVDGRWRAGTTPEPPATIDPTDGGFREPGTATALLATAPAICTSTLLDSTNTYDTVGEIHTGSDMTDELDYGTKADSDVGVGTTIGGSQWHISGSVHVGNVNGSLATWLRGEEQGLREKSLFHFEKRQWYCPAASWQEVKATTWNGGAIDGGENHSYDHRCDTTYLAYRTAHAPGTAFTRSTNDYVTFTIEVGAFGVDLTNQSGASNSVTMRWEFNQPSGTRYLCGDDAFPTSAGRIFAGT